MDMIALFDISGDYSDVFTVLQHSVTLGEILECNLVANWGRHSGR
jgi:hypothetical protein